MSSLPADTPSRILDVAEGLVQTRGFNAFSYADIAAALRITKASLHYHFPTKSKLGERLIERYRLGFQSALDQIDADTGNAAAKLQAYADIYVDVLTRDRMCLCGMLAADYATLSEPMRDEVRRFFEANEAWLLGVLRLGRERGELVFEGPPLEMARLVVATLEGAMLLARAQGKPAWLRGAASRMLAGLGVRAPAPQPVSD